MTNHPFMQYEHESGVIARWHGGEYIELGYVDEAGGFIAGDVYNVWDHLNGRPRIERTLDDFRDYVDSRLAEDDKDEDLAS